MMAAFMAVHMLLRYTSPRYNNPDLVSVSIKARFPNYWEFVAVLYFQ